VQAFSAHAKRLAALLSTPDVLSLMSTCHFFAGSHGERMLLAHAAAQPRPVASESSKLMFADFPLPGDDPLDGSVKEDVASAQAVKGGVTSLDLRRRLLVRQTASPMYGVEGVTWSTSPEYYTPKKVVDHRLLFSRYLHCSLVFWLDVIKPFSHALGPGSDRFLYVTVHRSDRGFGQRTSCTIHWKHRDGSLVDANLDVGKPASVPLGNKMHVCVHGYATMGRDVQQLLVSRFWNHDGGGSGHQSEAVVLVPLKEPAGSEELDPGVALRRDVSPAQVEAAKRFVLRLMDSTAPEDTA